MPLHRSNPYIFQFLSCSKINSAWLVCLKGVVSTYIYAKSFFCIQKFGNYSIEKSKTSPYIMFSLLKTMNIILTYHFLLCINTQTWEKGSHLSVQDCKKKEPANFSNIISRSSLSQMLRIRNCSLLAKVRYIEWFFSLWGLSETSWHLII